MHPLPKIRNPPWISTLLFLTTWYSIRVVHRTIPGTCAAVATGTNFCGVHVVSGRTTTGRNRTLELWIGAWKSTPVPGTNLPGMRVVPAALNDLRVDFPNQSHASANMEVLTACEVPLCCCIVPNLIVLLYRDTHDTASALGTTWRYTRTATVVSVCCSCFGRSGN